MLHENILYSKNTETISANKALTSTSPQYQILTDNTADRDVTAEATPKEGRLYGIKNGGTTYELQFKNNAATAIGAAIPPGDTHYFLYDSAWIALTSDMGSLIANADSGIIENSDLLGFSDVSNSNKLNKMTLSAFLVVMSATFQDLPSTNTETLSADKDLDEEFEQWHFLDPNGADRVVNGSEFSDPEQTVVIQNTGDTYNITFKNYLASQIGLSIPPKGTARFFHDTNDWRQVAISDGVLNVETLSIKKSLNSSSEYEHEITPDGVDVSIEAEATPIKGRKYRITNSGTANVIIFKNNALTQIVKIAIGITVEVRFNGTEWKVI